MIQEEGLYFFSGAFFLINELLSLTIRKDKHCEIKI